MTARSQTEVLIITGHSMSEPLRVSIHFMAMAAFERGHRVSLFVAGLGPAVLFKAKEIAAKSKRLWHSVHGIEEYTLWQPATPVDLRGRLLNTLTTPIFSTYGRSLPRDVLTRAKTADIILLESGVAAPYLRALKHSNLLHKTVYFAADDVRTVRGHPLIRQAVQQYANKVKGCFSFGAHGLGDTFLGDTPVFIVPKGIDTTAYEKCHTSPYNEGRANVVSVGNMLFDERILVMAAQIPEVNFHFIGSIAGETSANVILHGVLPFEQTVGYIKFATAGMLPYRFSNNIEYLKSSSMKYAQFRACGLPIIGPDFMDDLIDGYHAFITGDEISFSRAVRNAVNVSSRTSPPSRRTDFRENWLELENRFLL